MSEMTIVVKCESCAHSYRGIVPAEKRNVVRAARSNADIWAQTHRDVKGHSRYEFTETTSHYRIFGRSDQMTLSEDPRYSELSLGQ